MQRAVVIGVGPNRGLTLALSSIELEMRAISNSCTRAPPLSALAVRLAREGHEFYRALRSSFGKKISQRL